MLTLPRHFNLDMTAHARVAFSLAVCIHPASYESVSRDFRRQQVICRRGITSREESVDGQGEYLPPRLLFPNSFLLLPRPGRWPTQDGAVRNVARHPRHEGFETLQRISGICPIPAEGKRANDSPESGVLRTRFEIDTSAVPDWCCCRSWQYICCSRLRRSFHDQTLMPPRVPR